MLSCRQVGLGLRGRATPFETAARCWRPIARASASESEPRPIALVLPVTGERYSNRHEREPRADSRMTSPRTSASRSAISPEAGKGVVSIILWFSGLVFSLGIGRLALSGG